MSVLAPEKLFHEFDGSEVSGFAAIHSPVHRSPNGVPYLLKPGVVVLARPEVSLTGLSGFLDGFDESLHFPEYLDDPTKLPDGAQLCKVAGQTCYMSFGRGRTFNAQATRYFDNLKSSGHGSVLEHANFSLLLYGISRSVTHELVRHRAGFAYCLTGDTLIYSEKIVNGKRDGAQKRRLDDLYAMTRTSHGRSRIKLLRLRCLDEQTGTFTKGKVKTIVCSGVKPVFTVTLADGKTITATKEHRFLTKEGWLALDEIVGGLSVSSSGLAIYQKVDAQIMVNGQPMYKLERKPWLIPKPVKITSIIYAGEQMTYDIEMEEPYHNFVANGIITHNSQVSQRYVSGRVLRFVERPEYAQDEQLHGLFLQRIERSSDEYAAITNRLAELQQAGSAILSAEARTDLLKKVRQSARSALPNETEAPIVVTGNGRSWRHVIEMRADAHAEVEIRELAVRVFLCLYRTDPVLFSDYTVEQLPDGTLTVKTEFRKV
jgi:thymidylate synthase ThyX